MDIIHCSGCGDPFSPQNPSKSENYVEDMHGDLRYIENFCGDCTEERGQEDAYDEHDHDDMYDVDSALGSAGMGTDEYYDPCGEDFGFFGEMGMHED